MTKVFIPKNALRNYQITPVPPIEKQANYYQLEMTDAEIAAIPENYSYNPTKECFELDLARQAQTERKKRDTLITEVDAIASNPLRWQELSNEQQQAIAQYRKDLLAVPDQAGFPECIQWPKSPL